MVLRFQNKMIKPGLTKIEKWYDSEAIKTLAFGVEYIDPDVESDGVCIWNNTEYARWITIAQVWVLKDGAEDKLLQELGPEITERMVQAQVKDNGGGEYAVYMLG